MEHSETQQSTDINAVMNEVNAEFGTYENSIRTSAEGRSPVIPDFFRVTECLESTNAMIESLEKRMSGLDVLSLSELHRKELKSYLESRLFTAREYKKILETEEKKNERLLG